MTVYLDLLYTFISLYMLFITMTARLVSSLLFSSCSGCCDVSFLKLLCINRCRSSSGRAFESLGVGAINLFCLTYGTQLLLPEALLLGENSFFHSQKFRSVSAALFPHFVVLLCSLLNHYLHASIQKAECVPFVHPLLYPHNEICLLLRFNPFVSSGKKTKKHYSLLSSLMVA